jgi:hypothetical protein
MRDEAEVEHSFYVITTLHDTIMMDICHYTSAQTYRVSNSKSEP